MTEGIPPSMPGELPDRAVPPRRTWSIAPEALAAVVSVALIATVAAGVLSGARLPGGTASGPTPVATGSPSDRPISTAGPGVNSAAVTVLLQIDARLATARDALKAELAGRPFEPANVNTILRGVNADLVQATDIAARLGPSAAAAALSKILTAFYGDLHHQLSEDLLNSVQNAPAYLAAATATVKSLDQLGDLDTRLRALLKFDGQPTRSPSGSAGPSNGPASAAPTPVGPTPTPVAPTPTPARSPASPAPSQPASAAPGEPMVNPGFESGVTAPWELVLGPTAQATFQQDLTVHDTGSASGRVDITAAGEERAAVAVRQGGMSIEAGSRYVATISVRADTTREVRIRITSAAGDTYATRLFTVGPTWQVISAEATMFTTDANAYLQVDLGRFATTTWLDDASFVQLPATGG